MSEQCPSFADPLDLARGPQWPNRFALAPLTNTQSHPDGTLSADEYDWLSARAEGGFGLTMTCAAYVAPEGRIWPGQLGISSDVHLEGLRSLADDGRVVMVVTHSVLALDLCDNVTMKSFCTLADGFVANITSSIKYFRDEFEAGYHTPAWELFPYEKSVYFPYERERIAVSEGADQ